MVVRLVREVEIIFIVTLIISDISLGNYFEENSIMVDDISEHSIVTDNKVFPYVVAVLNRNSFLCTGALIGDEWILTSGQALLPFRQSVKFIKIRLGSTNYKKGGILSPSKYIEIHPQFVNNRPEFDVALIRLAKPVRLAPSIDPIRVLTRPKEVTATHFIMTAWRNDSMINNKYKLVPTRYRTMDHKRILKLSHLHPIDIRNCSHYLEENNVNNTENIMCFESTDPCKRETGAPIVLNRILYGIVSPWHSASCGSNRSMTLATAVYESQVYKWVYRVMTSKDPLMTSQDSDIDYDEDSDSD